MQGFVLFMTIRKKQPTNKKPKQKAKKQKQRNQNQQIQPIRFSPGRASIAFLLEVHFKSDKTLKQ